MDLLSIAPRVPLYLLIIYIQSGSMAREFYTAAGQYRDFFFCNANTTRNIVKNSVWVKYASGFLFLTFFFLFFLHTRRPTADLQLYSWI